MTSSSNTSELRAFAKRIPGLPFLYHKYLVVRQMLMGLFLGSRPIEKVFTDIYAGNKWTGKHSVSGPGSELDEVRVISEELPSILRDLEIRTLLDIPCGDFHWMQHVNLERVSYIGADIVPDLIHDNQTKHERENIKFLVADLTADELPKADLIMCRDCLVHLSNKDLFLALHNICNSEAKFLLTTTFPEQENNQDIATGQWRKLNLQARPFFLPEPLSIKSENSAAGNGAHSDKAMALWTIRDIEEALHKPAG